MTLKYLLRHVNSGVSAKDWTSYRCLYDAREIPVKILMPYFMLSIGDNPLPCFCDGSNYSYKYNVGKYQGINVYEQIFMWSCFLSDIMSL